MNKPHLLKTSKPEMVKFDFLAQYVIWYHSNLCHNARLSCAACVFWMTCQWCHYLLSVLSELVKIKASFVHEDFSLESNLNFIMCMSNKTDKILSHVFTVDFDLYFRFHLKGGVSSLTIPQKHSGFMQWQAIFQLVPMLLSHENKFLFTLRKRRKFV